MSEPTKKELQGVLDAHNEWYGRTINEFTIDQ